MEFKKCFPLVLILCLALCQTLLANPDEHEKLPPDENMGLNPVSLAIGDVRLENNCVEITLDEVATEVVISITHLDGVVTENLISNEKTASIPLASNYRFTVILEKDGQDYVYILPQ